LSTNSKTRSRSATWTASCPYFSRSSTAAYGGNISSTPTHLHLEFLVDADAAEARVLAADATKFDVQPTGPEIPAAR
jgi:hypothetical protein